MEFVSLLEKISNPLRKQSLEGSPSNLQLYNYTVAQWKRYIMNGEMVNDEDQRIKDTYLQYKAKLPDRAEAWLDSMANAYARSYLRSKVDKTNKKVYEHRGIQVFVDPLVTESFDADSLNLIKLKSSINMMLQDIKDILPNRKPRIVITDKDKNPKFKGTYTNNPPALYSDRIIYIDQYEVNNPDYLTHEFAHYVADLIPKQTYPLLERAYNEFVDNYWKRAKVKKQRLQPEDPANTQQVIDAKKWRRKISEKLGFPEYGLMNPDEFFAVLIENWKKLPNNTASYRFKSSVKNILQRL